MHLTLCDYVCLPQFKRAMKELTSSVSNFATVFFYRGIVNARAIAYVCCAASCCCRLPVARSHPPSLGALPQSYLAIWYNLSVVYLELTLVRVVLAWLGAIMVTPHPPNKRCSLSCLLLPHSTLAPLHTQLAALIPGFIRTTPEERARVASPLLVGLKAVGTALVVVALVVLAKDKS